LAWLVGRLCHTWLGEMLIRLFLKLTKYRVFSFWTAHQMELDIIRLRARRLYRGPRQAPAHPRLHFGSGRKLVSGWVNVDVIGTTPCIDLADGELPWPDQSFDCAVSQHVIEHLELEGEVLPLLKEVRRVLKPGGEIWLSCPDLEIVCRAYLEDKGRRLRDDRLAHATVPTGLERVPSQQFINKLFNQDGEHKNLFDLEMFQWALSKTGFTDVRRVTPQDLLDRFPEFPRADNDMHSIYVRAIAGHNPSHASGR
jgi:predicted SAM-dependent methyltransferase